MGWVLGQQEMGEKRRGPHLIDGHSLHSESLENSRVILLVFLKGYRSEVQSLALRQVEGGPSIRLEPPQTKRSA